jgi:hypothetical protein
MTQLEHAIHNVINTYNDKVKHLKFEFGVSAVQGTVTITATYAQKTTCFSITTTEIPDRMLVAHVESVLGAYVSGALNTRTLMKV